MKNPLTAKERRGLAAVAAAALLCICSGFIFRSCSARGASGSRGDHGVVIINNDSVAGQRSLVDSVSSSRKSSGKTSSGKTKKTKKSSSKGEKIYPTRSPLDEPCD